MSTKVFSIKIAGEAGQGIKSSGILLAKFALKSGFNTYNYIEYPSLIRGGHNVVQINFSNEPVTGAYKKCDFLVALDQKSIDIHANELTKDSIIIYNENTSINISTIPKYAILVPIPFAKLITETGGESLLSNTVALGATARLLGGNINIFSEVVKESFKQKDVKNLEANLKALELGYNYVVQYHQDKIKKVFELKQTASSLIPQTIINGNEACAWGAIHAGLDFAAIYPMSPISGILAVLAENQEKYGYIYKQPEDEISAIHMALGASFGGARSLTATSGGGFCLMTEGYGLAGMTETPVVIIEGMRGGPATGLPTWSEQGDLRMVLHSHQGDFPRIVLAPGDAKEAFYLTMEAFNLADIYQTPVVILIDKNICDNDQSFERFDFSDYKIERGKVTESFDPNYKRYKLEEDGISPRAFAGSGNFFIANSDEHDEYGISTEDSQMRTLQVKKRMQKLITCANKHMKGPTVYGPKNSKLTLVSWGSNKGPILQTLREMPEEAQNINYVHITWLNPFPASELGEVLKNSSQVVCVENNYSAQLAGLIRENTGIEIPIKITKYDGRPFFVEELADNIKKLL